MHSKIYEKLKKIVRENIVFIIILLLILLLFTIKIPYVVYTPGGYISLNDRIEVKDSKSHEGSYNMAFVSMYNGSIPAFLLSFIIPNWDIEKTEDITLDDQSMDELIKLDKIQMESSIDAATILAYEKAGKKIENIEEILNVAYIEGSAKTELEVGDKIISVDDLPDINFESLTTYLQTKKEDDKITITVLRDDKEIETESTLQIIEDSLKIGIVFISTYDFKTIPDIIIESESNESGPSGGLMLSLAIYDYLIDKDLTKGYQIVGTGTINVDGTVGEIDGIKYKLLGAKDADIFFCPKENYEDALKVKEDFNLDIDIYKVTTFDEAIDILNAI